MPYEQAGWRSLCPGGYYRLQTFRHPSEHAELNMVRDRRFWPRGPWARRLLKIGTLQRGAETRRPKVAPAGSPKGDRADVRRFKSAVAKRVQAHRWRRRLGLR